MNETYIKEFILDGGFVNEKNLEEIEEKMFSENLSFLEAVIELGILEQEVLNKIMSLIEGVPSIDLKNKIVDLETFLYIPEPVARTKKIIPFDKKDDTLFVAINNKELDYDFIRKLVPKDLKLKIFLADKDDINKKISDYQKLLKDTLVNGMLGNLNKISRIEDLGFRSEKDLPKDYMADIANDYYTEKFIKELLEYAKTSKASHVYIKNGEKENLIIFRINGENYSVMGIEKDTLFSISLRLKKLADISIFSDKEIIREASFKAELYGEVTNIFLSFIKTIFGESITLELAQEKDFGTDFITVVTEQKEILYKNLDDNKGFYIISGESKSGKTKTMYSIMEYEVEKNKEIYSLEENILHRINFVNQILIDKKTKKEILLTKIIQNQPDLISIDYIKSYILKTLFNYVDFGGKVVLGIKNDIRSFISTLLEFNFNKGKIIRNFNLFIEHKKFFRLKPENKKKVFLTKNDLEIIRSFLTDDEILNLFKKENLISKKISKVEKIPFYTNKKNVKQKEVLYLRGITDLGLSLENLFLSKLNNEKIYVELSKNIKRSILENALILSHKADIDIKEVLSYLTK